MGTLLEALHLTLSDPKSGEERLHSIEIQGLGGFSPGLCSIITEGSIDPYVRQLASTVLKKHIKNRWDEISCTSRDLIKQTLMSSLSDPISKVSGSAGSALAMLCSKDGDNRALIAGLVSMIGQGRSPDEVQGALRCLARVSDDIEEQQLTSILPTLLPSLHSIVLNTACPLVLRRRAMGLLHSLVSNLSTLSGAFQRQVRDLMEPLVAPWLPTLCEILAKGVNVQDPSSWALQMEVLKVLLQLVSYFSRFLSRFLPGLMASCWKMLTSGLEAYQLGLVDGKAEELEPEIDSEGDLMDLEAMLAQMFELLIAMVGSKRCSPLLRPACKDMAYIAVGYMQMTAAQSELWSENMNQFVADEEDEIFTTRVSGELLLDELHQAFGRSALEASLEAVERCIGEAAQAQARGQQGAWRLREAALLALGGAANRLHEGLGEAEGQRVRELLQGMLVQDLQGSDLNPFLSGRALWAASKLADMMTLEQSSAFLEAGVRGLRADVPPPVRIGAIRVIAKLLPKMWGGQTPGGASSTSLGLFPALYEGLIALIAKSSEETLHLVLETLTVVVKQDKGVVQQFLPSISLPVLHVWSSHVSDPLLAEDALELLGALANIPACLEPLAAQVLPTLSSVVGSPSDQPPMLVEGCMDLMRVLLQPGNQAVARAVFLTAGKQVMQILSTSSEAGMLQGAVEVMCDLVYLSGQELLQYEGALEALMQAAGRLLSPTMEESQSVFVGHLLLDLLEQHPQTLAPMLPQVLDAVVVKLLSSNMMPLVSGLLLVVAKLALRDPGQLIDVLAAKAVTLTDGTQTHALGAIISLWLDRARDMQGRFRTALCMTALGRLLETAHPRLSQIQVRGRLLDSEGGVQTRRQAAAAGAAHVSHTSVSADIKILMVLADQLADLQEATAPGRLFRGMLEEDEDEDGEEEAEAAEGESAEAVLQGTGLTIKGQSFGESQQALLDLALQNSQSHLADNDADVSYDGSYDGDGCMNDAVARPPGSTGPNDPLSRLDLASHLVALIGRMMAAGDARLALAEREMSTRQKSAVSQGLGGARL